MHKPSIRAGIGVALGLFLLQITMAARAEEKNSQLPTLPRLVDLGAGKCIPCKKMAPILEEMKKDYAGIVDIVFVDVWKDPKAGKPYKIRVIPTQVFYDRAGREVFRHEGFFSREDIEKVFQEKMGVTPLKKSPKDEQKSSSESIGSTLWEEVPCGPTVLQAWIDRVEGSP